MADTPQIAIVRLRLAEAELAWHKLNTGQQVAEATDQNGERVKFSVVDLSRLESYMRSLRSQLPENFAAETWPGRATSVGFIF